MTTKVVVVRAIDFSDVKTHIETGVIANNYEIGLDQRVWVTYYWYDESKGKLTATIYTISQSLFCKKFPNAPLISKT